MCLRNWNDPKSRMLRGVGAICLIVFVLATSVAPMLPGAHSGWAENGRHFIAGMALGINLVVLFALVRRRRVRG